ncbi:MAG TPA: hypothetical protein PKK06_02975 [Phycisphaerae bacterium]|nr:hypothetical protein [Phycisphaerae bacterium]HNU44649.1 hypothetical protein [Phycisphaerae bacterium]
MVYAGRGEAAASRFTAWAVCLVAVALPCLPAGCHTADKVVQSGTARTRALIGKIEPTGTVQEVEKRGEFWDAARGRLDQLDVEAVNATLRELEQLTQCARERVEAVSPEEVAQLRANLAASAEALQQQLADAPIRRAATAVLNVAETLDSRLRVLELDRVNILLQQANAALDDLRAAVEQLRTNLTTSFEDTQRVLQQAQKTVQSLPNEELRQAVVGVQEALAATQVRLNELPVLSQQAQVTLRSLRLAAQVATATLVIIALCGLRYLFRRGPGRRT